jgi:hypothetical protein
MTYLPFPDTKSKILEKLFEPELAKRGNAYEYPNFTPIFMIDSGLATYTNYLDADARIETIRMPE